jgi:hypothetical protein
MPPGIAYKYLTGHEDADARGRWSKVDGGEQVGPLAGRFAAGAGPHPARGGVESAAPVRRRPSALPKDGRWPSSPVSRDEGDSGAEHRLKGAGTELV